MKAGQTRNVGAAVSLARRVRTAMGSCGLLLTAMLAAGCAGTPRESADTVAATSKARGYKVGNPYQVKGVWYYPQVDYDYSAVGVASWYGPGFDGRATANGETYDMNDLTAAHKTLPLPSIVRVTNLENGRSIKLRVNDRGPFVGERIIDVSRRAAQLLGFYTNGTASVRVEVVGDESRQLAEALGAPADPPVAVASLPETPAQTSAPAPIGPAPVSSMALAAPSSMPPSDAEPTVAYADAPPLADSMVIETSAPASPRANTAAAPPVDVPSGRARYAPLAQAQSLYVQAGAFADAERAARAGARLSPIGPIVVSPSRVNGRDLLRVRVGPLRADADAGQVLASVSRAGFPDCRLVSE
ncbi:MAG: septal ring lytic transglycosylase RlpA family protein [Rhodospirillales bacterium]|nr:septal ring lytic transglycosylase RlpA family protein [Rhodospirillales bacterium]